MPNPADDELSRLLVLGGLYVDIARNAYHTATFGLESVKEIRDQVGYEEGTAARARLDADIEVMQRDPMGHYYGRLGDGRLKVSSLLPTVYHEFFDPDQDHPEANLTKGLRMLLEAEHRMTELSGRRWITCSPELLATGVSCADTPRRWSPALDSSHQHLLATS